MNSELPRRDFLRLATAGALAAPGAWPNRAPENTNSAALDDWARVACGHGCTCFSGREFYMAFDHREFRSWDDARACSFLSASSRGGADWTNPLWKVKANDCIYVFVHGHGYVGAARVDRGPVSLREIYLLNRLGYRGLWTAPLECFGRDLEQESFEEWFVRVAWLEARPLTHAISGDDLFMGERRDVWPAETDVWPAEIDELRTARRLTREFHRDTTPAFRCCYKEWVI